MVVDEGLGREGAPVDPQQACAASGLVHFIEIGREDFLEKTIGVARRALPSVLQVDLDELEMLLWRLHAFLQASAKYGTLKRPPLRA
jgi:hypothetical protein